MSTETILDSLYKDPPLRITLSPPVVFIADTHVGDGSKADDFWPYRFEFEKAIEKYAPPWTVVTLGDIWEWYQFGMTDIMCAGYSNDLVNFLLTARVIIPGNHDWELGGPEAAVLTIGDQEIFCVHGHRGQWINDGGRHIGRWLVRYIWTPMERIGVKEPQLPGHRHEAQRVALVDWGNTRKIQSVFGHIHTFEETGYTRVCESPTTGNLKFLEFTLSGWNVRVV